ncbi:MAG: hypothetical protein SF028_06020 [Candidatus Sumerlaeia bacterium]|nr:hypothetical protein [Candidatus Sumerlaeia bacterium]
MPEPQTHLARVIKNEPNRPLTEDDFTRILAEEPHLAQRVAAARAAAAAEAAVVKATVDTVLRRFDFVTGRAGYGPAKCYRDVGGVYHYAVLAMLAGDPTVYENKLLLWMRTIIQALAFPEGSIAFTYALLRKEASKQLPAAAAQLLDPYLALAEKILPAESVLT